MTNIKPYAFRRFIAQFPRIDYKVTEFLTQIGFTTDEIAEFYRAEPDGFDSDGEPFYGTDETYAIILQDSFSLDLVGEDFRIESFWEAGWFSENFRLRLLDLDIHDGRWNRIFQTRYKLSEFKFTKSLRRVLNKNKDLKTVIRPFEVTPEKSALFDIHRRMHLARTPRKTLSEYFQNVTGSFANRQEVCIFKDEKLIACSIFEEAAGALFSNAAFWDPNEAARSLGTLTLLAEVQHALSKGIGFNYFGIFNAQNPGYYYKTRFGGFELYDWDNERWVAFGEPRIKEMLRQKLPRRTG